jgi:dTDP-4-dehydrorhamnose reductase
MGEAYATLFDSDALVVRIRLPFGLQEHPRELITKFLTMNKFHDVQNSMTCVEDFLWALNHLVKNGNSGVYNVVNHGTISPYEIACEIKKYKDFDFENVDFRDIKTDVERVNVQMTTGELNKLGIPMRDVKKALIETLEKRFS